MILHPAQEIVAQSRNRFRVVNCGRRWGKTTLSLLEMVAKAVFKDDARVVYIAPTYQQARDIAWNELKKVCRPVMVDVNESRLEITVKTKNGGQSIIWLRGWESVETLRGQAFDFIVIDEIAMMRNFWVNWQEVLRPTLTDRKGEVLFVSTPKGFNHFYDLCNLELTDKDFKTFHFISYDNPHLPVDELDSAKGTLPPDRFAQEYEASFQKTQGLVYKEFSREKHLYDELPSAPPPFNQYVFQTLGAVDFGYRNPAAVLTAKWSGEKLYIEDEWYKRERTDNDIADYVALQKFKEVYPDPENTGGTEELRRRGIYVKEVIKGPGSIKIGINMVRDMLIRGDLMVNKRCVNLISEFEMYSYDDDKGEKNEQENPVKANDHALDALRYLVSSLLPMIQRQSFLERIPSLPSKPRVNRAR